MSHLSDADFHAKMVKQVADGWSVNESLSDLVQDVIRQTAARMMPEPPTDGLVRISVTLPETDAELQLMSALDQLCARKMVDAQATARAVRWLGTKHDPQFVEER